MIDQDSQELFEILNDMISKKVNEHEINRLKTEFEEDRELLNMKIDNITSQNNMIREENRILSMKNDELTRVSYTQELTIKELESRNADLLLTMDRHYNDHEIKAEDYDESVLISMQLSEIKGKLEAREKNFIKFKDEHERIVNENNTRIFSLQQENDILRDKSLKYDILKEKYERSKSGISCLLLSLFTL